MKYCEKKHRKNARCPFYRIVDCGKDNQVEWCIADLDSGQVYLVRLMEHCPAAMWKWEDKD